MESLREQIKAAEARAYSLKTKKAQEKAWKHVRELKHELLHTYLYPARDKVARHSVKGMVTRDSWPHDEHIPVETKEYGLIWLHPTTDENSKSWYPSTCCIEYTKGQELIIEFECEVNLDHLLLHVYPKRSYGGTLNETKYAELCKRENLAFFKYPDGHMSGLFAQGGAK